MAYLIAGKLTQFARLALRPVLDRSTGNDLNPSGSSRSGTRLSPRRQLHRHGLPHRWKAHPVARLAIRPAFAHSTRNNLNPRFKATDHLIKVVP